MKHHLHKIKLSQEELKNRLSQSACGLWIPIGEAEIQDFKYYLVNTQYCKYPALIGYFDGLEFRCAVDKGVIRNVSHLSEVNDLGTRLPKSDYEQSNEEIFKQTLKYLDQSILNIRRLKLDKDIEKTLVVKKEYIENQIKDIKEGLNSTKNL